MRQQISLSGNWQFQLDPEGELQVQALAPDREIPVPLPWQVAFPELQHYSGYAWYRTTVELAAEWLGGEVLLQFGAVDYWCQVFINGQLAFQHEGGYTPFTIAIKKYAHPGRNEIALRVYDSAQTRIEIPRWPIYSAETSRSDPPFDANHIPHGKQEWYINVGGIWQDVTLTAVPAAYIDHVRVITDIHTGETQFTIQLGGDVDTTREGALQVRVEGDVRERWNTSVALDAQAREVEARVMVEDPRLWSPDAPHLYKGVITLQTPQGDDEVAVRFGFREIATRNGQLVLNGEPLFLLAALDQDIYPDTIYTVPSEYFLRDEFQKAKELGLNCLRCHIKPPDPRYLDLADEMGLLVWTEIPSWRTFYPKGTVHSNQLNLDDRIKRRAEQTLEEMIRRDCNHPSIVIWTIVNEDWGTSLPLSPGDRAWVAKMYDRCKELDPTRLVVDNSACPHPWGPNVHVKTDLDDFHVYANIPDQAKSFEQSMEEFNLRPLWTFSNHGDSQRRGDEPLILSEFGNWGLPSLNALREHYGGDPAWFELGPWWSPWEGEPGWATGVDERFRRLGLDHIWKDYEDFAVATQWHEFAALKFEIETLRRQPSVSGYVITELADIYWESNGLLDFVRNPKIFHEAFPIINSPDMIIPEPEHYASWDDQPIRVCLHGAHFSERDWAGAKLSWAIRGTTTVGERELDDLPRGGVRLLDVQSWNLPRIEEAQDLRLQFRVYDRNERELARNHLELLVLPARARRAAYRGQVTVIASETMPRVEVTSIPALAPDSADVLEAAPNQAILPDPAPSGVLRFNLETSLRRLGYQTNTEIDADTGIVVTNLPNAEMLRWVREGGRMLFISSGPSPFFWVQTRGGAYSGNWISSFTWLRPQVHRRLNVSNPIGMPFRHVMPTRTILGLPVEDAAVQDDFLSGMISGWVRHPAIHTVQFRYGRGRVVMTTFSFEESLRNRPAAIALLHDLIDHLASDACDPTLAANY